MPIYATWDLTFSVEGLPIEMKTMHGIDVFAPHTYEGQSPISMIR